jgi:hypothetical protein
LAFAWRPGVFAREVFGNTQISLCVARIDAYSAPVVVLENEREQSLNDLPDELTSKDYRWAMQDFLFRAADNPSS